MKVFSLIKCGFLSVVSIFCAHQSVAATIKIDMTGTITKTFIQYVVDDNAIVEDAGLWEISSGLPVGSTLNFSASYDTNASSIWSFPSSSPSGEIYQGAGLSIDSSVFHALFPSTEVGVTNSEVDISDDGLSFGSRAPYSTGIKINFQNEIYYLIAAAMGMTDATGKALGDVKLPTDQSELDAFWLNNPSGLGWSHAPVASFTLYFVKDPLVHSDTAQVWPNGKTLYVQGYFDVAKLTKVDAPEPAGLFLAVIGMLGLAARRARKN